MTDEPPQRLPLPPGDPSTVVAALDLGSNSFHMIIGRFVDRELQIVDRMREQVCLAQGLDEQRRLIPEAQERALACLERMGQRLRSLPSARVRAVATNTLRSANDVGDFRARAEQALGHPIEIISGQEEARLIYLGVAHDRYSAASRLIVDIGGGSTELIIGEGFEVLKKHSLFMGCVTYSQRYFPKGALKKEHFRQAEIAARLELHGIAQQLRELGWERSIGTSGTVNAIREVLRVNGWTDGEIDRNGLKRLRRVLIDAGKIDRVELDGLKRERLAVLPGGLAIVRAIFKSLELETMAGSSGALREGVLHDLMGRIRHEDVRDRTISKFVERYHVDIAQATRVERTALRLYEQVRPIEGLEDVQVRKVLSWASKLHEIGLAISFTGFHKHSSYLIANAEMNGFSSDDQKLLATLVRGHRRRLSRVHLQGLRGSLREPVLRLALLFRLAVLLNRSRATQVVPTLRTDPPWRELSLTFPRRWRQDHPLTLADLEQESGWLEPLGVHLMVHESLHEIEEVS